ncbi:MAG: hypothetical protein K9W45_08880 [Candidatus Heimdallarchaeum aukensis]|uniref:DUF6788 domain-containing protein n=1 Tax=Candidatus Heimdallarchaeum aukensis TaxID=2876573 RepID=A0A9Y1FJD6_9ARCH|nr:MAG: hypothetical protein K9W45_08880 [Candidatus Heimdallarchaeum aukensis]
MSPIDNILEQLIEESRELEKKIATLSRKPYIIGFISKKYIKCGKKNCKCQTNKNYYHGPYYYLRKEPDYKYRTYLGKTIPENIEEEIKTGILLKEAMERKRKIDQTIKKISNLLVKK